ncbi:MAG: right-handed parallel beta-helix repeat-containing protein [Thermoanaerobaculia bacterium]
MKVGLWVVLAAPIAAAAVAQPPSCPPAATPVPLVDPTVLGNGTPSSVTTAAIQAALDAGGHITFDVGSRPVTIPLTAELVVSRETVLDGAGVVTLSGGGNHRVLLVMNPFNAVYTLTLQHLGIADGATPTGSGAGLYKPSGGPWQAVSLVAVDCVFADNTAIAVEQDGGGGAIYAVGMDEVVLQDCTLMGNRGSNGGALYSLGSRVVTVVDSIFFDNRATGDGGNPGNGGNGGAIGVDGAERQVELCGTDVSANRANGFGAGFFSVMYDMASSTTFNACTFDGNLNPTSSEFAGGAYIQGGPFAILNSTFAFNEAEGIGGVFLGPSATGQIVNSTFHGNLARSGLGGALFVSTGAPVAITNATIEGNLATGSGGFAAGIQVDASNAVTMKNTLLVDNVGGNLFNPWNIRNLVGDGGGNMQWPPERPNGQPEQPATATVVWADPALEPLAGHGGPTWTMPLSPGSPALDAGVTAGAPSADQRGVARTPPPDVGAFEGTAAEIFADGFESGDTSRWSVAVP